ncbi:MAG: hypothetical protein ACK4YP_06935 [Myxococcota bacterium]
MKRLLPVLLLLGCPEPSEEGNGPPPDLGGGQPPGGAPPPGDGTAPPPAGDGTTPPPAPSGDGTGTGGAIPKLSVNPGEGVKLSGTVTVEGSAPGELRLDLSSPSSEGAGQKIIHAVTLPSAGPWEIEVPKDLGTVTVTFFVDADGDGPSPTEPTATINDVSIKDTPVTGLNATLKGSATPTPPADGATAPAGGTAPADGTAPAGGTAPTGGTTAPAGGATAPPAPAAPAGK